MPIATAAAAPALLVLLLASEPGEVAAVLRRQTQEMMDAVAAGHREVLWRYLHENVVYLDEKGVIYDKDALLRELTPLRQVSSDGSRWTASR